jgi:hypothetical protein
VVVLCTIQRDVVHAGYLALALYFFRERGRLRLESSLVTVPSPAAITSSSSGSSAALSREASGAVAGAVRICGSNIRSSGSGIFWMLPAFNFSVLVLELAYQVRMVKV